MDLNQYGYRIVTQSCSKIRSDARASLKGCWLQSFLVMILELVIVDFAQLLGFITKNPIFTNWGWIWVLLMTGPISCGLARYFTRLARGRTATMDDLFAGFSYAWRAVHLALAICVRVFLWSLLFVIPGIIASYKYGLAQFILAEDPSKSVSQCLQESKEMMDLNKMKMFILSFSFIGWYFLAGLPVGILSGLAAGSGTLDVSYVSGVPVHAGLQPGLMSFAALLPMLLVTVYVNTASAHFYLIAKNEEDDQGGANFVRDHIEYSYTHPEYEK